MSTPLLNLEYRLRLTLPSGDLGFTSQQGGTNPYLSVAPSGDGTQVDPLTGQLSIGTYTGRVIDAPTALDGSGHALRVLTHVLEDATARQQLLSRRAIWEYRQFAGSALGDQPDTFAGGLTNAQAGSYYIAPWVQLCSGYVTGIRLVNGIEYEITVGESLRIERALTAFAPKSTGVDVNGRPIYEDPAAYLARWPQRGCLLGGPLTAAWLGISPLGGMVCQSQGADSNGNTILKVKSAQLPPAWKSTTDLDTIIDQSERTTSAFWGIVPLFDAQGNPTNTWRNYADLLFVIGGTVYRYGKGVNTSTGTATGRTAHLTGAAPGFIAAGPTAGGPRGNFIVDGPAIASGVSVRVQVISFLPTEGSPLYWTGHPVDLLGALWSEAGIPYDASSLETVRAAIGGDRRLSVRITSTPPLEEFLEQTLFGPFGIGARLDDAGNFVAYATRAVPSAAPTLTLDGTVLDVEGATPFDLSESTAVTRVVLEHQRFYLESAALDATDVAPDGIAVRTERIERSNVDVTTYGTREQTYTLTGMVHTAGSTLADAAPAVDVLARDVFDRWGRGLMQAGVTLLRGTLARASEPQLGDEVLVNHPAMPNRGYRLGDNSSVGARSWQVIAVTQSPRGAVLKLADFGPAAQPIATLPVLSIAQDAADARTLADVTITNAAALNTAALGVRVQYATTSSATAPSVAAGADVATFPVGLVPTGAVALPRVSATAAGVWVWARARCENSAVGRSSAWSSWVGVQLASIPAPSALVATHIGSQSVDITWTNGSPTDLVEVYAAPGSTAPSDWPSHRVAVLPAGSTLTRVRRLAGPGQANVVGIAHSDGVGGRSAAAWITFTTSGTPNGTAPRPAGLSVLTSGALDAQHDTGIAIACYAADEVFDLAIWRAPDLAGAPDVTNTVLVNTVPGDTTIYVDYLPSTSSTYWYALGHTLSGETDSPLTPWRAGVVGSIPVDLVRPSAAPAQVSVDLTETTTLGTVALTVTDPQGRVTHVQFRTRTGTGAWSAWADAAGVGSDPVLVYTQSAAIPSTGFETIGWQVLGYDDLGNLETLFADEVPFDANTLADIVALVASFTQAGQLIADATGDSDTQSLRVGVSTVSAAAAQTAAAAATPVDGREVETTFAGPYQVGQSVWVSVIGYPQTAGGGTASPATTMRFVREGTDLVVREQTSETTTTGTLSVVVTDRTGRVSSVQFRTQQGRGGWSAYGAADTTTGVSPTLTYTKSVALVEKLVSKIAYQVIGTDAQGNTGVVLDEDIVPFVAGAQPMVPDLAVTCDASGNVSAVATGDSDTASIRLGTSTVSSAQAITNAATGTAVNGRVCAFGTVATIAEGVKLYLAAYAFSGAGATGSASAVPAVAVEFVRPPDTKQLIVRAEIIATTATSVTARVRVADPQPQGLNSVTISYTALGTGGVLPASGQTGFTPTTDVTTSGFVDFTITRSLFQAGTGRVAFTAAAAGRTQGTDSVDVPEQQRDTVTLTCTAHVVGQTSTTESVQVDATDPLGTVSPSVAVQYDSNSGAGAITGSGTSLSPYVIPKAASGSGARRVVFQATGTGRVSAQDAVDVPEQTATGTTPAYPNVYDLGVSATPYYSTQDISFYWSYDSLPASGYFQLLIRSKGQSAFTSCGTTTNSNILVPETTHGLIYDASGNLTPSTMWVESYVKMFNGAGVVVATAGPVRFESPLP